jgi:hypothetical protein
MENPNPNQMELELRPLQGGAYTQLSLRGPVCSDPRTRWMRQLLRLFSYWNGYPVRVVLFADVRTGPWLDVWCDVLASVPGRHHEVVFRVAPTHDAESQR